MNEKELGIAIVGAGLIGKKRAEAIRMTGQGKVVVVVDVDEANAVALAREYGAESSTDWKSVVSRADVDIVIVAVPNAFAAPIVIAALQNGKHVLCEKPFGITAEESRTMHSMAVAAGKFAKVGFNHRFHAGIAKAHEIFENGGIGKILFIRARYGHGGRKGIEHEWRFDKKISGGGELLDQGVHIVDLARWFGGEFTKVYGRTETKFWDTKVDDNAFALLMNDRVTASFHVSTTNWKNIFSFEVFGDLGFLQVDGKSGSYGEEILTYGKRRLEFGVPDIERFTFESGDTSWQNEWRNFVDAILGNGTMIGDAVDGVRANELIEAIYRSSAEGKEIFLKG